MKTEQNKELKEKVRKHIKSCMLSYYYSDLENQEGRYQRLDELFLLWDEITERNFVNSVEEFGISYEDFTNHNHQKVKMQIEEVIPEIKERGEDERWKE